LKIQWKNKNGIQQAVWQNGGFGAFLEAKVLNQSSGIFSNFGAENRHFAKLLDVMHKCKQQHN
jgi:hypothetical protein